MFQNDYLCNQGLAVLGTPQHLESTRSVLRGYSGIGGQEADKGVAFSITRFKALRSVFRSDAPSMTHAYIAQLLVLFEDLRIELYGITELDLGKLDSTDPKYRRHYFVRRSVGTWSEFAEAIRLLDELEDFQYIKALFDATTVKAWDRAVRFFGKHESYVKAVRNDIGGHFGPKAARYAVENLRPEVQGKLEVTLYGPRRAGMRVHFAGEIAATATFRSLPGEETKEASELRYRRLLRVLKAGWRHGTRSTDSIAAHYLWERFQ